MWWRLLLPFMIVVADPRYEREIYHDHENGLTGQDQTDVLITRKSQRCFDFAVQENAAA